jgi:hypothetical protein
VRKEEALHRVKEKRNVLHKVKRRKKTNWIGRILQRNCILKHVVKGSIEGKREVTRRRGRICSQLRDYLKEMRRYWKLNTNALNGTLWKTGFERDYGLLIYSLFLAVVRHTLQDTQFFQFNTPSDIDKWPRGFVETKVH